ncbi:MAG TPA: hypothetical protein DCO70_06465, partial [Verrucomicrobiales bacterium]|nr:hypothetical protein [Verrucomicrobiales bacterium]
WEGSGILYQVTVKPIKVDLSKEAAFLSGKVAGGLPLRSGKLKATIVLPIVEEDKKKNLAGRLHIRSGKDVFVFTRF